MMCAPIWGGWNVARCAPFTDAAGADLHHEKERPMRDPDELLALDRLMNEVEEAHQVQQGATLILQGTAQAIRDLASEAEQEHTKPKALLEALNTLADKLDASTSQLAEAVEANTRPDQTEPSEQQTDDDTGNSNQY